MITLDKRFADEIISHAREEAPNECCGLLLGTDGRVLQLRRTTNSLHSPDVYKIEPNEMYHILKELDAKGWDIVAVYHSHTHTQAYPSPTDIQKAFWPDALYLIVSLQEPAHPILRAFQLRNGQVTEEEMAIV